LVIRPAAEGGGGSGEQYDKPALANRKGKNARNPDKSAAPKKCQLIRVQIDAELEPITV
jgi:hypothetical protein